MENKGELAVLPPQENAQVLTRRASDVAGLCKEIVLKTACSIQGKKYVKVEGWQSIATAHGCVAGCSLVERVQGGVRAVGELRRMQDNSVIATAEGFVGEDEPTWFGGVSPQGKTLPKRAEYAIRAMAQTRAISRVCRSAFAHVVVLMDAGLSTTPAEEVPEGGFDNSQASAPRPAAPAPAPRQMRQAVVAAPQESTEAQEAPSQEAGAPRWQTYEVPFGKNKGKQLQQLASNSLAWYCANIDDKNVDFRAALDAAQMEVFPDGLPD